MPQWLLMALLLNRHHFFTPGHTFDNFSYASFFSWKFIPPNIALLIWISMFVRQTDVVFPLINSGWYNTCFRPINQSKGRHYNFRFCASGSHLQQRSLAHVTLLCVYIVAVLAAWVCRDIRQQQYATIVHNYLRMGSIHKYANYTN